MQEKFGYRRKQYLVAKKFQLKYAGMILALVFLTGILCSYVVYYTSMFLLGDKLANVYPQGRLISIVNMVNIRILLSLLIITPLVLIIGIYASHRIAGPIYRMEKFLNNMASGDLSEQLVLRKNDELISLANGINCMADSVKTTVRQEREYLARTAVSLDSIRRMVQSKSVDYIMLENAVEKLIEEVSKASRELDKYKV